MFRNLLTVAALVGAAAFAGLTVALPAQASSPPTANWVAQPQPVIRTWLCMRGGGRVVPDLTSPTLRSCWGGRFHGMPVHRGFRGVG